MTRGQLLRKGRSLSEPSSPPDARLGAGRAAARAAAAADARRHAVHEHRRLHDHDAARAAADAALRHRPAGSSAFSCRRTRSPPRRAGSSPRSGSTASTASTRCSRCTPASSSRPRCAALAPNYALLVVARLVAGVFGGVVGALVLTIVADVVPYARRARGTALVSAAFSLAAVMGVPLGLWFAAHYSWRAPFLALAALSSARRGSSRGALVPPIDGHLRGRRTPESGRAAARDLRRAAIIGARSRSRSR